MAIRINEFAQGTNLEGYNVQEGATPIDPGSFDGGTNQFSFSTTEFADMDDTLDQLITLTDDVRGTISGYVRGIGSTPGYGDFVADSALDKFNTWHSVPPFYGNMSDYIAELAAICNVTNPITYTGSLATFQVVCPGFYGNVWDALKQFCSAKRVEIALVNNVIQVRSLRSRVATLNRSSSQTRNVTTHASAATVDINYYNYRTGVNREVFPLKEDNTNTTTWVVGAGQRVIQTIQLFGSLRSVNQPTVQDFVYDQSYTGTTGVYAVVGADSLPVTAAQWTANGGNVVVRMTDDPSVVEVQIDGANISYLSPFRIAMVSGPNTFYNSLHITGHGVASFPETLTLHTGAPASETGQTTGVAIDNPFVNTLNQAYTAGIVAAGNAAGPETTLSGETTVLTMDSGQFFGSSPGSRILTTECNYRIDNATTTEHQVSYNATIDTTVSDFNAKWSGKTIADFNAQWTGKTLKQFRPSPLRRNV